MNSEDIQTEERDRTEPEGQEPHLTVLHAVGMIILLTVLQLLLSMMLSKSKLMLLEETSWLNIAITHAVSGLLTAQAGAILAGFSLLAILTDSELKFSAVPPLLLGVFGISILSSELSNFLQWIEPIDKAYVEAFQKLFQQNRLGVFFAIGIVAPVAEELIFRGVMLEGLRSRYRLRVAIFTTTLLFGIVHIFPWVILNAFLLGLFFAWLKLETRSLMLCIVAHGFYNSLPFLFTGFFSVEIPGYTPLPGDEVQFQPWWFDLLGIVLTAVGITSLRSMYRSENHKLSGQPPPNVSGTDESPWF